MPQPSKPLSMSAALIAISLLASPAQADPKFDLSALPGPVASEDLLPAKAVHSFPKGTFLESVAVLSDNTLLITEASQHHIFRLVPGKAPSVWHESGFRPAGLAVGPDESIVATGKCEDGTGCIGVFSQSGELLSTLPIDGSEFLNGATFLTPTEILVAEANLGRIYRVDLEAGKHSVWSSHKSLRKRPDRNPGIPGVNGLKIADGYLYASNSSSAEILRFPIRRKGLRAGKPEVMATDIIVDDFALAADGTLYGTTHIFDSVVRIEPDGTKVRVAGPGQPVLGTTAAQFGRAPGTESTLFVVGDGGLSLDPDTAQSSAVAALETDETGAGLAQVFDHLAGPDFRAPGQVSLVTCLTAPDGQAARERLGGEYTKFLDTNYAYIAFAGQVYGDGRDAPPTARNYYISGKAPGAAKTMMEASPYFVGGVYASCEAEPFDIMTGGLWGGAAWK